MSDNLRLLYSVPCQKPIFSANGEVSLIGLLETIEIGLGPEAPAKFIAPMKWTIVSLWTRASQDDQEIRSFEQKAILTDVDDDEIFTSIHGFETPPGFEFFRTAVDFPGIPIAHSGFLNVEVSLREKPSEEWIVEHRFPINVKRTEVEADANQDQLENEDGNDKGDDES